MLIFHLCCFVDNQFSFKVQGKPLFEVPLSELTNVSVSAKNEVTVELTQNDTSATSKRLDSMVDIRFYIPPNLDGEVEGDEDSLDSATVNILIYEHVH